MGATLNRRDSVGLDFTGAVAELWTILLYVFKACFGAFSGVLRLGGTMYHPKTDAYHFPYGDYQGKKTGRWERELHGSDPHQARRSASLPREPDLRLKTSPQAWGCLLYTSPSPRDS